METEKLRDKLEELYRQYNRRKYVEPDPLQFLYDYEKLEDREIVGLVAASLAYGKVDQILKSVKTVLKVLGDSPREFLQNADYDSVAAPLKNFVYRFNRGEQVTALLWAVKSIVMEFGSLNRCFCKGFDNDDGTVLPGIVFLSGRLASCGANPGHLVANPAKGSACKRMNLFLRWMVRRDQVDPGGWKNVPADKLIIPLDIHMHRISLLLKLTARKPADMKTAMEITENFKKFSPDDPVKYDFALTRFGIRRELSPEDLLR